MGYLHKYENNFPKEELDALTKKALKYIFSDESKGSEHTLLCYQRFYSCTPKDLREELFPQLPLRIQEIVNTDENEWREKYVPKPLDFAKTPTSPFYNLFPDLVEKNLDFLIAQTEEGDAWFPTWTWGGKYEDAWESAKREWAGKISVENLTLLKNFGRIE